MVWCRSEQLANILVFRNHVSVVSEPMNESEVDEDPENIGLEIWKKVDDDVTRTAWWTSLT